MIIYRNNLAINLNNVTTFKVETLDGKPSLMFLFNCCDSDGIREFESFKFISLEDAKDAFAELLTQIHEVKRPVFYMDDEDLWPERKGE